MRSNQGGQTGPPIDTASARFISARAPACTRKCAFPRRFPRTGVASQHTLRAFSRARACVVALPPSPFSSSSWSSIWSLRYHQHRHHLVIVDIIAIAITVIIIIISLSSSPSSSSWSSTRREFTTGRRRRSAAVAVAIILMEAENPPGPFLSSITFSSSITLSLSITKTLSMTLSLALFYINPRLMCACGPRRQVLVGSILNQSKAHVSV